MSPIIQKTLSENKKGGVKIFLIIIGLAFLCHSLTQLPKLMKNKQNKGKFFSADTRILVVKQEGKGSNLNLQNPYAFFSNVIIAIVLIGAGLLRHL